MGASCPGSRTSSAPPARPLVAGGPLRGPNLGVGAEAERRQQRHLRWPSAPTMAAAVLSPRKHEVKSTRCS